jgi:hypothetical protein
MMDESSSNFRHEQIAKVAYELWEKKGPPSGSVQIDWQMAEQILGLDAAKPPFAAFSLEANEE